MTIDCWIFYETTGEIPPFEMAATKNAILKNAMHQNKDYKIIKNIYFVKWNKI